MAGRQPDAVIACVGGGSNAMGIFTVHPGTRASASSASRPPARRRQRPPCGFADRRRARRPAATAPTCCRTPTARSSTPIPSRPASTTRRRSRARLAQRHSGRAEYVAITDAGSPAGLPRPVPPGGHHPALESSPCLAYAAKLAPTLPRQDSAGRASPVGATRTCTPWPKIRDSRTFAATQKIPTLSAPASALRSMS